MVLFAHFLAAVSRIVHLVLTIYIWIIIFRAILSWVHIPSLYTVSVILYRLTEPVLSPFRRVVPPYKLGGIDISPILVILVIMFLDSFVVDSLSVYAQHLMGRPSYQF
ncbi:YggT family protein [bacterium]|nr:YggT family protein [bacterium]